jgi:hypothetical protein
MELSVKDQKYQRTLVFLNEIQSVVQRDVRGLVFSVPIGEVKLHTRYIRATAQCFPKDNRKFKVEQNEALVMLGNLHSLKNNSNHPLIMKLHMLSNGRRVLCNNGCVCYKRVRQTIDTEIKQMIINDQYLEGRAFGVFGIGMCSTAPKVCLFIPLSPLHNIFSF